MPSTIHSIVFDCVLPSRLAQFWAAALGGYAQRPYDAEEIERLRAMGIEDLADDPTVVIDPFDRGAPTLFFVRVPEPKATKNRVHLDLRPEHRMEAEVARLVELGATERQTFDRDYGRWTVLADPEGNEFCVIATDAEVS